MPVIPPTPWNDVVADMQTGDLILFSGTSTESEWIELLTGGLFSHSTMIYRPDASQPPLMWQEAPEAITYDPETKSSHGGAQLGDALTATQVIFGYGDTPYYVPLDWTRPASLNATMAALVTAYEERPFGTVLQMALDYAIGHLYNQSTGDTSLYCAALVATTYMGIGVLDDSHPANWYAPNSFGSGQRDGLPWTGGASLSDPILLSVPPSSVDTVAAVGAAGASWPAGPLAPEQLPAPPPGPPRQP
jgi:hypothetical protein